MKFKIIILFICFTILFWGSGCIEKTLFPKVVINIAKVEPQVLIPTATDTASLPQINITVDIETPIPLKVISYSVIYKTNLGQILNELTINEMPYYQKLQPTVGQTITLSIYTRKVVELFELTPSNIAPIIATIYLKFTDANENTIVKEVVCQLFPYESSNQTSSTSTSTTTTIPTSSTTSSTVSISN